MSSSRPEVKRRICDEHRKFQEKGEIYYFFVDHRNTPICLICTEKAAVHNEYNIKRHYSTIHAEEHKKYQGDKRANQVTNLKTCLLRQQNFFKKGSKESWAAVETSYAISEMIAKAGRPFTEGKFIKKCMLQAANIICSEKKSQFNTISLSENTVAERVSDMSSSIYEQLRKKAKCFSAYSIALDESTDITDTAQLAVHLRGIDENFEAIEESLT